MPKLTKADKAACVTIRNQLDSDLPVLLEHLGVKVRTGNMSFDPTTGEIHIKIKVTVPVAKDGGFVDPYRQAWETFIPRYSYLGLKHGWLDKSFTVSGKTYKIIGYDPKKRAKPVMLECSGKRMVAPIEQVVAFMEKQHG